MLAGKTGQGSKGKALYTVLINSLLSFFYI